MAAVRRLVGWPSFCFIFNYLIRPCQSYRVVELPPFSLVSSIFVVASLLMLCYIFYPAYISLEGGISCEEIILTGKSDRSQGQVLSLVIPAYNEEKRLPSMLDTSLEYLNRNRKSLSILYEKATNLNRNGGKESDYLHYEFIVVDDGSVDDTANVVRKYATTVQSGDTIKLVLMRKNSGKGGAVKAGMLRSSGHLCLMLDADGATDISDGLVKLLKEMEVLSARSQYDKASRITLPMAVFGSRAHLEEVSCATRSKVRTLLMHAFHFFVKMLCSSSVKDTQCGFKIFNRPALVLLFSNLHLRRWAFDTELIVIAEKLNVRLSEVGVVWNEVDGSKLDIGKFSLALVSAGMLRDMICVRLCYFLGIWRLKK